MQSKTSLFTTILSYKYLFKYILIFFYSSRMHGSYEKLDGGTLSEALQG